MLTFDPLLCTGCRICEQTCFQVHYQGNSLDGSRIKIYSSWPDVESVIVCRQCLNPYCVEACPTEAIQQVDGVIRIDHEKCTRCHQCFEVCPFKANVIDQQEFPVFCDTCNDSFQCTRLCPTKAVKRGDQ